MPQRLLFYRNTVSRWITDRTASVLIVAGGANDRDVFAALGFSNVVISNVDDQPQGDSTAPYLCSRQNVEALTFPDLAFDYVVVHAGLHHCHSPHRGLLEMYRVARRAIIAFEPPDNALVRIMQRLGLAQVYECTAVRCNQGRRGGVNNSAIPNYIFRWTEHEIEKVISSCAPIAAHRFHYAYGADEPTPEFVARSPIRRLLITLAKPAYRLWGLCFPRQQNLFGFMIEKPVLTRDIHPWLVIDGAEVKLNPRWGEQDSPHR